MISMTGYGYKEVQQEDSVLSVELKSYNNRYLDISANLPSSLNPLESKFREIIGKHVRRGRVEFNLRYHDQSNSLEFTLDNKVVDSSVEILNQLRKRANIEKPIELINLQKMDGLININKAIDLEKIEAKITPVLDQVLDDFVQSRIVEGKATKEDISVKLRRIINSVEEISSYSKTLEKKIKENLKARFTEVLGDDYDLKRVYSETAVLLVRFSINEELERLNSHIISFSEIIEQNQPIGKKLDFLAQEMNREINTIGSKNILKEVSQAVVNAKDALEQIREQLRNIE